MIKHKINKNDYIDFKRKKLARLSVHDAIRKKTLTRSSHCEICNLECKTNAHHIDYGKPLDVMWLCSSCHGNVHTKDHDLNPINNHQTKNLLIWEVSDMVTVSFNIPIKQFMLIKKKSIDSKKKLSRVLREDIEGLYVIQEQQLEFDFEKVKDEKDTARTQLQKGISVLDEDENGLLQQIRPIISILRGKRDNNMPRMEQQFFDFSGRNGTNASGSYRVNSN